MRKRESFDRVKMVFGIQQTAYGRVLDTSAGGIGAVFSYEDGQQVEVGQLVQLILEREESAAIVINAIVRTLTRSVFEFRIGFQFVPRRSFLSSLDSLTLNLFNRRRSLRIIIEPNVDVVVISDGQKLTGELVDISIGGLSVSTDCAQPLSRDCTYLLSFEFPEKFLPSEVFSILKHDRLVDGKRRLGFEFDSQHSEDFCRLENSIVDRALQ